MDIIARALASKNAASLVDIATKSGIGIFNASGSSQSTFGSINSGSNQLTISSALDFQNNQGVYILHAGVACTLSVPTGLTVTPTGTAGTTTYQYQIVALDVLGGCTGATSVIQTTTGNATLSATNYNALSWTPVTGAKGYAIYGRVSGTMQLLDCVYNASSWNDIGVSAKGGAFYVPTSPPASQVNNSLVTTISNGAGTTTLTLATIASATVSSVKVYHDDTNSIQTALNSNSSVQIPTGTYYVSNTLNVPMYVKVILTNQNVVIKPLGNFNVVQIGARADWDGGVIDLGILGSYFTAACIYVYPNYTNGSTNYALRSNIQNVRLVGYGQSADGILLDAPQVTSGNANAIEFVTFKNIWLENMNIGLHLRSIQTTGTIQSWLNGCLFHHFTYENCINSMYFDGNQTTYNQIQGHMFTDFQVQTPGSSTKYVIYCSGKQNYFQGYIWDYSSILTSQSIVYLDSNSQYNKIVTNMKGDESYYVDFGLGNQWDGWGQGTQPQHKLLFPNSIHNNEHPTYHKRTGFVGDQDDILAYATKRGITVTNVNSTSVTTNPNSAPTSNVLDYLFNPNGDDYLDIAGTSVSSSSPFQLIIDMSANKPRNFALVGVNFRGQGYYAQHITMEFDNGNGSWQTFYTAPANNNNQNEVWGIVWDVVARLRLSFWAPPSGALLGTYTDDHGYSNHIRINRIFGVANGDAGVTHLKSYNPVIYGGITKPISTVSANYTITKDDSTLLGNASTAAFTFTLPDATTMKGREYIIKKVDSSANAVTIGTTSSQTIDGATTQALSTQWGKIKVQSDGTNWQTV